MNDELSGVRLIGYQLNAIQSSKVTEKGKVSEAETKIELSMDAVDARQRKYGLREIGLE